MSKSEDHPKSSSQALQARGCFLLGLPASLRRPCRYGGHPLPSLRVQTSAFTLRGQRPMRRGATPILLSSPLLSGTTVSHLQMSNSPLCPVNPLQLSRLISKHPTFLDLLHCPQEKVFRIVLWADLDAHLVSVLFAQLCPTLCDPGDCIARQAPLSVGFSRQEYWTGLPFPSPGDLPNPGVELRSPALQADFLLSEPPGKPV